MPRLDDSANQSYGSDSANSICGDQTLEVVQSNGNAINYLTLSVTNGVTTFTVDTSDTSEYGLKYFQGRWAMVDYSRTKSITFYAYIMKLTEPYSQLSDYEWNMGVSTEQRILPYLILSPTYSSWTVTRTIKQ